MEQTISDFLSDTCRVRPKPNIHKFNALQCCIDIASRPRAGDYSWIATSSGSSSEFYIQPMLSCINDYDVMHHRNDMLAIPTGHPVPLYLSEEFHNRVTVYRLEETEFPGYVFVRSISELVKRNDDYYESFPTESAYVSRNSPPDPSMRHGPAVLASNAISSARIYKFSECDSSTLSIDRVFCIRCLNWPPQAADWPTRRRKHDWPEFETIECVVNNGCDVVQISHPQCKQDEFMRDYQWRLSFSRAETVLLNSWSVKQQIVYHIIRIFMKTVRVAQGMTDSVNNYLTKTVTLWACELDSPNTWDSHNVISICKRLISKSARCLKILKCSSYFVAGLNILDGLQHTDELKHFVSHLIHFTGESFDSWLINNYVRQCAHECPAHIQSLFPDDLNTQTLSFAMSEITRWRKSCNNELSFVDFSIMYGHMQLLVFSFSPISSNDVFELFIKQLNHIDSRILDSVYGAYFLRVASKLDAGHSPLLLAETIVKLIQSSGLPYSNTYTTIDERQNNGKKTCERSDSGRMRSVDECKYFQSASELMRTSRTYQSSLARLSRLFRELSKIYLYSALECNLAECRDFHSKSRYLLNVYLACLYCITKTGKTVFDRSWLAIENSQQHSDELRHIELQLLPCFHEPLENIFGLILLYSLLRTRLRGHEHAEVRAHVCTADLFAFYLEDVSSHVHCSKHITCRSRRESYYEYEARLMNKRQLTVADVLLFREVYRKMNGIGQRKEHIFSVCDKCRSKLRTCRVRPVKFETERMSQLLAEYAVDHLTIFRLSASYDFCSVRRILAIDFIAMFAYKYRFIEKCFQLCRNSVACLLDFATEPVTVFNNTRSDLLYLMEDDCLSLIALSIFCGASYSKSTEPVTQLTLLLYLLIQSKLQLSHPPETFINDLPNVTAACLRHSVDLIINRGLLMFAYRKAVRRLS